MANSTDKRHLDDDLIGRLLAGDTATQAAAALGMSVSTVYLRQRDPSFKARLNDARAELWREGAAYARDQVKRSFEVLVQLRDDPEQHASTRARCSVAIIENAVKLDQVTDVHAQLSELRDKLLAMQQLHAGGGEFGCQTETEGSTNDGEV